MTDNPTVTLDTSGLPCPAPLLGAKKLVDDLQPGQTLKLISDCQGTADDLFAWARYTGNQVLETRKLADGKTAYVIQRAGSAAATPIPHVIASWARAGAAELLFSHETGKGIHEFFLRRS